MNELFPTSWHIVDLPDGEVRLHPEFFPKPESDALLSELLRTTNWRRDKITIFGKTVDQPRLTAWYGEPGAAYTYSGITMEPEPWTPTLLAIKSAIEPVSGVVFNSVLLNWYRDGSDSMGWHSDDEPELGENPVIASVSFGEMRRFHFRRKGTSGAAVKLELGHGSLLLMCGATQHHWQHQVPKTRRACEARVNLTFRVIRNASAKRR